MIWFFLAGFISGWAGCILHAHYWVKKHTVTIKIPANKENKEEESHD